MSDLYHEIDGVITDVERGNGFDDVCLQTLKRVRDALQQREPEYELVLPVGRDGNVYRFDCGHEIPLFEFRAAKFTPTCTHCEAGPSELREAENADAAGVHTAKAVPDAVSALVEKWRTEASQHREAAEQLPKGDPEWSEIFLLAVELANCADELEAALKGGKA